MVIFAAPVRLWHMRLWAPRRLQPPRSTVAAADAATTRRQQCWRVRAVADTDAIWRAP